MQQSKDISDFERELAAKLATKMLGQSHRHLSSTGSTNDDAAAWAQAEARAPHGALVTADHQSKGRGRLGRVWDSGSSLDIYASLVIRPETVLGGTSGKKVEASAIAALGLAVGLGIVNGLEAVTSASLSGVAAPVRWALKWPNDILVNDRKVAGILCEARWQGETAVVVAGFGINVGRRQFAGDLLAQATSVALLDASNKNWPPARAKILAAVLVAIENRLQQYLCEGFGAIRADYEGLCRELGQSIRLGTTGPDGAPSGTLYRVHALDHDGALLVQRPPHDKLWRVQSADVWLQKPER